MKLWLFYLNSDGSLYAYTNEKKLAKSFIEERDMDKFHYKKYDIESKNDYYKIVRNFSQVSILRSRDLRMSDENGDIKKICLTLTDLEDYLVVKNEDEIYKILGKHAAGFSPDYFSKEVSSLLNDLFFFRISMWYHALDYNPIYSGLNMSDEDDDISLYTSNLMVDELQLLISLVGESFK